MMILEKTIRQALLEHSGGMKMIALMVYLTQDYTDAEREIPTDLDELVYDTIEQCPEIDIIEYGAHCGDAPGRVKEFVYFKLRIN